MKINIPAHACSNEALYALKRVLHSHEGYEPTIVFFQTHNGQVPCDLGSEFATDGSDALKAQVRALLGLGAIDNVDH